jgi:hypothetical protein
MVFSSRGTSGQREARIAHLIAHNDELFEFVRLAAENDDKIAAPEDPSLTPKMVWYLSAVSIGLSVGYELATHTEPLHASSQYGNMPISRDLPSILRRKPKPS